MDDGPFLAAIAEAGEDDLGPRLVYADWLEERGDPRSEFIRLQCADSLSTADELRMRWLELEHRAEWLRPVRQAFGTHDSLIRRYDFVKGFPARVEMQASDLPNLPGPLAEISPFIRHCGLWHNTSDPDVDPDLWHQLAGLRGLTTLGSIKDVDQRLLASSALKDLREFRSTGTRLGPEGLARLSETEWFSQLHAFELGGMGDSEQMAALARAPFPRLRKLDVSAMEYRRSNLRTLLESPWFSKLQDLRAARQNVSAFLSNLVGVGEALRVLVLSDGHLESADPTGWQSVQASPTLDSFSLKSNSLNASQLEALSQCGWLRPVRRLALGVHRAAVAGLVRLLTSPVLRSLVDLDLTNCRVDESTLKTIVDDSPSEGFVRLQLQQNRLTATALRSLLDSRHGSSLRSLSFGVHSYSHGADMALGSMAWGPLARQIAGIRLEELHVEGLIDGSGFLAALAREDALASLRSLTMSQCDLTDEAVEALATSQSASGLLALNLSRNPISRRGAAAIDSSPWLKRVRELTLERRSWSVSR